MSCKNKTEDPVSSLRCASQLTGANSTFISRSAIPDLLSEATDDINIESAAAEFVKNYLGSDDNEAASSSGDRLLTALGLCDENSYEDAELQNDDASTNEYPQTVIVYPQSPLNVSVNPAGTTSQIMSSRPLSSMTSSCVKCVNPPPTVSPTRSNGGCVPTGVYEEELTSLPNEAAVTIPTYGHEDEDYETNTGDFSAAIEIDKSKSNKCSMQQQFENQFSFAQNPTNSKNSNITSAIDNNLSSAVANTSNDDLGMDLCIAAAAGSSSKEERRVKIANLETKLQSQSQPWNEHVESMSLISKMQSNITESSDAWSDSPDSTN